MATDADVQSPRSTSEDTARGSIMSSRPSALLLNQRSSIERGISSPIASPPSSKLDSGFALRREGSTGSGRTLCKSRSAWKRPCISNQSEREEPSSKPRRCLVTSSLFSTLSLGFETERNRNKEGTENEIIGITLFDKEDIARLSMIVGRNLWNEDNKAAKSISQADAQAGMPRPEAELERAPPSPPNDTLKTEVGANPGLRGYQIVTTSQLATQQPQLQSISEQ